MRRFQQVLLFIMLLIVAAFILIFILENNAEVAISFLSLTSPTLPIAVFIVTAFLLGLVLALIIGYVVLFKVKIKLTLTKKQLAACKKELANKNSATLLVK